MRLTTVSMLGVAAVTTACCAGSEMRSTAFIAAARCPQPPSLDGTLDDPAWQAAPPVRIFYEYHKPQPGPGLLKTEARMLYDDKGVYLGVTNFDDNISKLREVYTARDAENLWTDDCNEIYFDAVGQGVGWTKFVVNAIGTMADARRVDSAISLPDWNGSGWQVKTSKRPDAWIVEAFFPWSDLGDKRAEPGSLWRFCLVRYAYTSGKFVGVSSSPGGYYNSPQNFGVLLFGESAPPEPAKVAAAVQALTPPPWFLPLDGGLLECLAPGAARFVAAADLVARDRAAAGKLAADVAALAEARKTLPEMTKLAEEFKTLQGTAPAAPGAAPDPTAVYSYYSAQAALHAKLSDIYWRMKVQDLMASVQ